MYQIYFILEWHSTCFGRPFRPSSGFQDCTYSNRHMSERYCCLLARYCSLLARYCCLLARYCCLLARYCFLFARYCCLLARYCCVLARYCCLLASKQTAVSVWQMPVAVCTVLNSWWWTANPSETCRTSLQNTINLIYWCIWLVLLFEYMASVIFQMPIY